LNIGFNIGQEVYNGNPFTPKPRKEEYIGERLFSFPLWYKLLIDSICALVSFVAEFGLIFLI
jgi:hypothetical protein